MATQYTFAKLTPPSQFRPEQTVTFKLEYSEDLADTFATLVIDGYTDRLYDTITQTNVYNYGNIPYKDTHRVNTSMGITWDVGYEEYNVPANSLGKTPTDNYEGQDRYHLYINGSCTARVEFRKLEDPEGDIIFTSNKVPVNLLIMWDSELRFYNTPYTPTSSTFTPCLYFLQISSLGEYGATFINNYRFLLYDDQYNMIDDSGDLYDWNSYIYLTNESSYSFHGLKDYKTYYIRAKVTLNGGYVLWRGYESINVRYAELPAGDAQMQLSNAYNGVRIVLDLEGIEHDRVVINRTVRSADTWLEVNDVPNDSDIVNLIDKYAITGTDYLYNAVVYNGNLIVATYNNYITFRTNNIIISDAVGSFVAMGNIEKYPISRNNRGQTLEAMDSKYPYYIINGSPDYDSGSVNALFAEQEDCELQTDNQEYSKILRAWLNNGRAKLLTYYTGESWIVAISDVQTTDPQNTDTLNTSFNWVQIGDAYDIKSYSKYGLVVTEDG